MATAFAAQIANWMHWITIGVGYGIGIVLILIAAVLVMKSYASRNTDSFPPQTPGLVPGIPTLSGLLGQDPAIDFNAKQFLALAYYSPVTAEVEKNIKIIAQQNSPNDKEAFYARFIGVGVIAYFHDVTWFTIFGSQLAALAELNLFGRTVPIDDLKKHYDKAVVGYPKTYENYTFEQWVDYMKSRSLLAVYPSQMVELSFGGKDFLKYVAHRGWNISGKKN